MNYRPLILFPLIALLFACASPTQTINEARILARDGREAAALKLVEDALKESPNDPQLLTFLNTERARIVKEKLDQVNLLIDAKDYPAAGKLIEQLNVLNAGNPLVKETSRRVQIAQKHRAQLDSIGPLMERDLMAARRMVSEMLFENPGNREAKQLLDTLDGLLLKSSNPQPKLADSLRRPISLSFRNQNIFSLFEVIAKISKINFIFDKDVSPNLQATIYAQDAAIEDAVNLILRTTQLKMKVLNENTVLIYPKTVDKDREYKDLMVRTFFLSNADTKQVSATIRQMVKPKEMFSDERLNTIVVRDTAEVLGVVERLIASQDLPQSETELEVMILELNESDILELGLRFPSSITASPAGFGIAPQGGFGAGATAQPGILTLSELQAINQGNVLVNLGQPSFTLNMNQGSNSTKLLANPKIRVKNREKASIQIGDRVPVVTTTTNLGVTSEMISYQDVGLSLQVEASISQDSEVGVKLTLEVSNIAGTTTTKTGLTAYQIGQRKAQTVLTLTNGETQILGGLISSNNAGNGNAIPGAANVPVLNRLLGSRKDTNGKSELVLLITPRIVRNVPIPPPHVLQFPSGTEAEMNTQPLTLRSAPAQ